MVNHFMPSTEDLSGSCSLYSSRGCCELLFSVDATGRCQWPNIFEYIFTERSTYKMEIQRNRPQNSKHGVIQESIILDSIKDHLTMHIFTNHL